MSMHLAVTARCCHCIGHINKDAAANHFAVCLRFWAGYAQICLLWSRQTQTLFLMNCEHALKPAHNKSFNFTKHITGMNYLGNFQAIKNNKSEC
eukprot:3520038-Amphidinium_carterae.1